MPVEPKYRRVIQYDKDGNVIDNNNPLPVRETGFEDTNNKPTELLLADAVYKGTATDTTPFSAICIWITSDVASADRGAIAQYSVVGGTNDADWYDGEPYTINAGAEKFFTPTIQGKYFRMKYTNGSTNQGLFTIHIMLRPDPVKWSSHNINDTISEDDDAELVKAILATRSTEGNIYENVDVQHPTPSDGDSVYAKDLDLSRTIDTNWVAVNDGNAQELFGDVTKGLTYTGSDNPKSITLAFQRAVITTGGMGLVTTEGSFSNTKLIAVQADGTESTLVDFSADNTDRTILPLQFTPTGFNAIRLEFHTADDITITNVFIPKAVTSISRIQGTSEFTGFVEDVNTFRSALKVDAALVHKVGISEHAKRDFGATTTLDVAASSGDTLINVADTTGFEVGNTVRISDSSVVERSHFHIVVVDSGVSLTLNRPIDNDFEIGDDVTEIQIGMNVIGTLNSPISFKIQPPINERWQITRMMTTMLDDSSMDDGKFGGVDELTNGVVIRTVIDGTVRTLTHWKSNADLKDDMYDVKYSSKAPAGKFGLSARWTFTKAQFVVDLDGATGDYLEVLIQDVLTELLDFEIKGQGRLFGG